MASIYKRGGKANRHGRYRISYFNEFGRRQDVAAGTSDHDTARQIADKLEADAALKRRGVITPQEAKLAELNAKPVADHVADYLAHCRRQGQNAVHVGNKETQLDKVLESTGAKVLSELSRASLQRYLDALADAGKSARTVNQHRTTIATFVGWCYAGVGVHANPLAKMPRMDEAADQRRVRRAMTEDELSKLMAVPEAIATGRADYYIVATLVGLRSGDGKEMTWGDVDLEAGTLRIRQGADKSGRADLLPLHPQALAVLQRICPAFVGTTDPVFSSLPRVKTFHRDCERAGVARYDAEGNQLDLHALGRTTFGTRLANNGAMPQMAMRLMRHADVKITMKHYTKLRLHDEARAVAGLPQIVAAQPVIQQATGTDSAPVTLQQNLQQSGGFSSRSLSPSGSPATPAGSGKPGGSRSVSSGKTRGFGTSRQPGTSSDLMSGAITAIMPKIRAISSVG
ncbi:MAG TPA: tyrosine-type recombinase/integrase [Tepidisphaeraceae bacterium]|nr:tyrosine-type recombinase/integrase [Tepidisphaeraceae bacterium]